MAQYWPNAAPIPRPIPRAEKQLKLDERTLQPDLVMQDGHMFVFGKLHHLQHPVFRRPGTVGHTPGSRQRFA